MTPAELTQSSPFKLSQQPLATLMWQVVVALIPGILLTAVLFGVGVIVQIVLALTTVMLVDYIVGIFQARETTSTIKDGTAAVLAVIVAISLPPYCPWWITIASAAVATGLGKHLYGGTGQNLFNPAMVGIVFALVCFPTISTYWPTVSSASDMTLHEGLTLIFGQRSHDIDAISGATLLEFERTQHILAVMRSEFSEADFYGLIAERGWEWVNMAYLFGGIFLCLRRVIKPTVPIWFLGILFILTTTAHGFDDTRFAGPFVHLFSGATIVCAFFIATDPVSSPTGRLATIIYAALLALSVFLFRHFSAYPDGVAFSVILLNALVPLLDRLLSKQIYGH